jgi:hypothetical protein
MSKLARFAGACYSVLWYASPRARGLRNAGIVRMITDAAGWDEHGLRGRRIARVACFGDEAP